MASRNGRPCAWRLIRAASYFTNPRIDLLPPAKRLQYSFIFPKRIGFAAERAIANFPRDSHSTFTADSARIPHLRPFSLQLRNIRFASIVKTPKQLALTQLPDCHPDLTTNCPPDRSFSFPKGMRNGVEGPAVSRRLQQSEMATAVSALASIPSRVFRHLLADHEPRIINRLACHKS